MKTIVVPTDFSAISLNAVNYAADLASVIKIDLSIVHVFSVPVIFNEIPVQEYNNKKIYEDAQERMAALERKIENRTKGKTKINTLLKQGDIVSSIDDYCKSVNVYAVVMGAESGHAYERFLFGAKTMEAIKRLDFPLIVVPQEAKFSRICKIGLACDMKDVIETVPIHEIRNIVNEFHAELHVLHVSPESVGEFDTEKKEESGDLQQMLLSMNPRYDFIRGIDVEEEIIHFAEKNKLDLLIVIPKYDNLLYKIFQKSNSDRIVLHAHIPVLTIHE